MPVRSLFYSACSLILVAAGFGQGGVVATASAAQPDAAADAGAVLEDVREAMGMEDLESLTYAGAAWRIRNSFRQTLGASPPWSERDDINNYTRTLDLSQPASLAQGETFARNLFLQPPVEGSYLQNVGADSAWSGQLELWLTPWGFVAGAEANGAEAGAASVGGIDYTQLTWTSPQTAPSGMPYTVRGYIDGGNRVRRVETWVEDAFMGDLHVEARYDNYTDMNGIMVPLTMEQRRGGGAVFGVAVTEARPNPDDLAQLMTPPEQAGGGGFGGGGGATPPTDLVREVGDGVWLVTGGYVAMVVEFADHVAVFEAGQSEARGEQILEQVKGITDKPIRYVINSHPHSDHTAGLIPFVREGATIVTHANNVEFLDMALGSPRTLLGEESMDPQFMAIEGVGVLEDDSARLELHTVPNLHTDGMLVGLLPERGILFQADFTLPQPGAQANPFVLTLAEYVAAQGLEFDQYLAVHAAAEPQTKADLLATIGIEE